jgi:hypothetical protein
MSVTEVNFSDLLNQPKETLRKLQSSPSRSLRVHRRAEEDLVLTTTSRAEQVGETISATTKLFVAMMKHDDRARALATEVVPEAFPWVRFLPADDVRTFVMELVDALAGGEALDNFAPVAQVVTAWRHTAEIHADPDLRRALRQDGDDLGPVPEP